MAAADFSLCTDICSSAALPIHWEIHENQPSTHWDGCPQLCVEHESRSMQRMWEIQQNESAKEPEAVLEREGDEWRRQRETETWRSEELCVRRFEALAAWKQLPQSLSDFDEAVPELISKPNSACALIHAISSSTPTSAHPSSSTEEGTAVLCRYAWL